MITIDELAKKLGGRLTSNSLKDKISSVGSLFEANKEQVVYASNSKNFTKAIATNCSAVISKEIYNETEKPVILVENPKQAYVECLYFFKKDEDLNKGVSKKAYISETAKIESNVTIMDAAVVSDNAVVGSGTIIYPGVLIADNVKIGKNCRINANAVLERNSVIGDNVIIHAGAVIGSDGFGFIYDQSGKHKKIPQNGNVVIENDVEIGANTTVDRATVGSTVIGEGTKIDNLVHIAHNSRIGKNNLILAQSGIAGSVVTGENCIFGGQTGIADHCEIEEGVIVTSKSGVRSQTLKANTTYMGIPARESSEMRRIIASMGRLPEKIKK